MAHKLNAELFEWMKANSYEEIGHLNAEQAAARRKPKWRLRDRLAERDIVRMIMAFETGMTKEELADRYGIHINSVKKILREHRMKRARHDKGA